MWASAGFVAVTAGTAGRRSRLRSSRSAKYSSSCGLARATIDAQKGLPAGSAPRRPRGCTSSRCRWRFERVLRQTALPLCLGRERRRCARAPAAGHGLIRTFVQPPRSGHNAIAPVLADRGEAARCHRCRFGCVAATPSARPGPRRSTPDRALLAAGSRSRSIVSVYTRTTISILSMVMRARRQHEAGRRAPTRHALVAAPPDPPARRVQMPGAAQNRGNCPGAVHPGHAASGSAPAEGTHSLVPCARRPRQSLTGGPSSRAARPAPTPRAFLGHRRRGLAGPRLACPRRPCPHHVQPPALRRRGRESDCRDADAHGGMGPCTARAARSPHGTALSG